VVIVVQLEMFCQMLTVHLEESDCFAAWVSAREVGIGQSLDSADPKCTCVLCYYIVLSSCLTLPIPSVRMPISTISVD
jgi:hypothetical protein